MAIIHPFNLSEQDVELEHGRAESTIIQLINSLDKNKTRDWEFYYSFSFKRKQFKKTKDCEIDFLCLLPNIGIFVLEIKGGGISKRSDFGEITYYSTGSDNQAHIIKNPYQQAVDNYYDFSELTGPIRIGAQLLNITNFVGGYCVGFPDMNQLSFSDPLSGEGSVLTYLKGKDLYSFFVKLGEYSYRDYKRIPTKEDIELIKKQFLQKDFTYKYDLSNYLDTVNVRVNQLTEEQFVVLCGLLENERCLINGPAGSGKTVLSEMLFKHFLNEHERVAYFSFNRFNSMKVKNDLGSTIDETNSICEPLYDFVDNQLLKLSKGLYCVNDKTKEEKIKELIKYKKDANFPKYNVIIIDEAQDLSGDEDLIDLFDILSTKTLKDSKIYVFYDKNQTLLSYDSYFYDNEIFGSNYYRYTRFTLTKNCRNSKNIAKALNEITSSRFKTPIDDICSENISVIKAKDINDCLEKVYQKIDELKDSGVNKKAISILISSYGISITGYASNYIYNELLNNQKGIKEYSIENAMKSTTFTTVNKFKGLESDFLIYIRCQKNYQRFINKSDYVAISRGKAFVYIIDLQE